MLEQEVIAKFRYPHTDIGPLVQLALRVEDAIEGADLGEYGGHEVAEEGDEACMFLYGPDADAICAAVTPVLRKNSLTKSAQITKRSGPNSGSDPEVTFGSTSRR